MKKYLLSASVFALVLAIMAGTALAASTLYWDGGTVDAGDPGDGTSAGGAGTWNTTIKNWDAGAVPHVAWVNSNNDTAIFGGTAGTVTLGTNVQVGGLRFDTSGYTISGPYTMTFGVVGGITNNIGSITFGGGLSITNMGAIMIGNNTSMNTVTVLTNTTLNLQGNGLTNGYASSVSVYGNTMTINGGTVTNVGTVTIAHLNYSGGQVSQNALIVTNGARLFTGPIYLGNAPFVGTYIWRSNTLAIVNSFVQASGALKVTDSVSNSGASKTAERNRVIVDGGTLQGLTSIDFVDDYTGRSASYKYNSLIVTNGGYVSSSGALNFDNVNGQASANVSNSVVVANGGVLSTVGANFSTGVNMYDYMNVIGGGSGGPTSTWNVGNGALSIAGTYSALKIDGAGVAGGAVVTNVTTVTLSGVAASMMLTNGARCFSTGAITAGSSANGNAFIIAGGAADSIWNCGGVAVTIGPAGSHYDTLTIGPGGIMTNVTSVKIGYNNSSGNQLVVAGNGALLADSGDVMVGFTENGGPNVVSNSVLIAFGGVVRAGGALIVGAVGYANGSERGNSVTVSSGGQLYTRAASCIGAGNYALLWPGAAGGNTVTVSGNSSLWDLGNTSLIVGHVGVSTGNTLNVTSGGVVTNAGLITIGTNAGAMFNSAIVSNGTIYSTGLTIGNSSSNNTVTLLDGGLWNLGGVNVVVGTGTGTGNSLAVNGGTMTNISVLTVPASSSLTLGPGGQIFANTLTNSGVMNVAIDSTAVPACGCITATSLNITGATLNISVTGMGVGAHVIAKYGSLPGQFAATNNMPLGGSIDYNYGIGSQIAIIVPAKGTVITIR